MTGPYRARVRAGEHLDNGKYCWYFRVYDDRSGTIIAMDSTGGWRNIYDTADRLTRALNECFIRGIAIKPPKWLKNSNYTFERG